MEKSEIECCGTTHLHDSLVHQIEDGMPKEETIRIWRYDEDKNLMCVVSGRIVCVIWQRLWE